MATEKPDHSTYETLSTLRNDLARLSFSPRDRYEQRTEHLKTSFETLHKVELQGWAEFRVAKIHSAAFYEHYKLDDQHWTRLQSGQDLNEKSTDHKVLYPVNKEYRSRKYHLRFVNEYKAELGLTPSSKGIVYYSMIWSDVSKCWLGYAGMTTRTLSDRWYEHFANAVRLINATARNEACEKIPLIDAELANLIVTSCNRLVDKFYLFGLQSGQDLNELQRAEASIIGMQHLTIPGIGLNLKYN